MRASVYKLYLLISLLFLLPLQAATKLPVQISIKFASAYENQEILGEIAITHQEGQSIDQASFQIEGKPLKVLFLSDTYPTGRASGDIETLVVSKFRFTLPAKLRGLYLLSPINVQVGDTTYASPSVSYEVIGAQISDELTLEARVSEKGPFYPGQKVTFQYLISFRHPIQLTKEELPLLEFPGFRTLGAPKIDNLPQGGNTVQLISQQALAQAPGTYRSGPSLIEGYIYGEDTFGNKVYGAQLIQAQAPDIEVTVLAFPEQNKPPSFTGALGAFYWKVSPITSTSVQVGEKISLEVSVTGSGDFDTVTLPDLNLQKGFKGSFRLSDLAPVGETKEAQKRFVIDIRPLNIQVKTIPAIEFSSFDPISKNYVIKRSDPIAIQVRKGSGAFATTVNQEENKSEVAPIDIVGNLALTSTDLEARHFQNVLLIYAAIFLFAVVGVQMLFHKFAHESKNRPQSARDVLIGAIKQKSNPDECCRLIRKALLLRLSETGLTKTLASSPEELETTGIIGEIRSLLLSIEKKRFMGLETKMEINAIVDEASQLFYRLN